MPARRRRRTAPAEPRTMRRLAGAAAILLCFGFFVLAPKPSRAPAPSSDPFRHRPDQFSDLPRIATLDRLLAEGRGEVAENLALAIRSELAAKRRGKAPYVIVGRIVLADGGAGSTAPLLHNDGYFAREIRSVDAPVGFRLHGYEPLDAKIDRAPTGEILEVGEWVMRPLAVGEAATLRGVVQFADGHDPTKAAVRIYAVIPWDVTNNVGNGQIHTPMAINEVTVPVDATGRFTLAGVSPSEYTLVVSAEGCVDYAKPLEFKRGLTTDVGTIRLEAPKLIHLTYAVSPTSSFASAAVQHDTVPAGAAWRAQGDQWKGVATKLGNAEPWYGHTLEFKQEDGKLTFWVFYQPASITDLGRGTVEQFRKRELSPVVLKQPNHLPVEDGHVYVMHHDTFDYWILFHLHIVDQPAGRAVTR